MAIVSVQRPSVTDVTRRNPVGVIYINEDEVTENALRMIPDTSFGTEVEFQRYSDGVWNDTGILIAASTVYLGRELQISAAGEWMLTKDSGTDIKSVIPHTRFDPATGTEESVVVAAIGVLNSDVILQPDDTGELEASQFQFTTASAALVLANALILRTAGGGATGPVTISLYRDGFGSGLFYQRTYPESSFPADSDIKLTTDGLVELFEDETFYIDISLNDGGFLDLKTDVTNTTPYWGGDFYFVTEDTITPDEQGGALYLLVTDESGAIVSDNDGGVVFEDPNDLTDLMPAVAVPGSPFSSAGTFSASTNTQAMSGASKALYRFTGTAGGTLTLSTTTKQNAVPAAPWVFSVKDEGGNCTANPLTIVPESGTIDGGASTALTIDYGSILMYTDGSNFWSI